MHTICIVGGGNLSHVCIGVLSSHADININLLTRRPDKWNQNIRVNSPDGKVYHGHVNKISSDPLAVVPDADIILLCTPAFCTEEMIVKIQPYISKDTVIGAIVANTGFFFFCHKHLPADSKLFGFQRVPYVSRIVEYGQEANLLGYRAELFMAIENITDRDKFKSLLESLFEEKISIVDSFYEVTLSNSNPILHTGRLYTMWKDWDGEIFDRCPLFYKEWTDEASEIEIKMDEEYFRLLNALGINVNNVETLLEHYESTTPQEMTQKIRSIESLSTILSPMKKIEGGWIPDFESRYFTEDFPFGLKFIVDLEKEYRIYTPTINKVFEWGMKQVSK